MFIDQHASTAIIQQQHDSACHALAILGGPSHPAYDGVYAVYVKLTNELYRRRMINAEIPGGFR